MVVLCFLLNAETQKEMLGYMTIANERVTSFLFHPFTQSHFYTFTRNHFFTFYDFQSL